MRAAAALLSSSRSRSALADVVRAAGLAAESVEIDGDARNALGLDDVPRADLAAGTGSVRVLLVELQAGANFRDTLQRMARRLSSRAPHVLWLLAAVDGTGANAAIIGWSNGPRAIKIASFLWETERVVDSDAETLSALSAIHAAEDVSFHSRCLEILGRDALTRRFYLALESQVGALGSTLPLEREDGRAIALLYTSRLLFLCFLEAKGWLNGERSFIAARFDECMRTGGRFHRRVLLPLFFGTLNTPPTCRARVAREFGRVPFLNGGLFTRTALERRSGLQRFSDESLGAMLEQLFQRFRFVAREDSATWSEASIDPEMLGRAFESLMASTERRASGVYYTPHELVSRVAEQALAAYQERPTPSVVRELRVLDPACGSGAFLVYVLERIAALRRALGERMSISAVRRDVLAHSIFGVDRSPTAVWLCELRLWLSVVIESEETDPECVPPLPNLDRNIRVGDSLAGSPFSTGQHAIIGSARILDLRQRYIRATGTRKQTLARNLDREERRRILAQTDRAIDAAQHARREHLASQRARDLFGQRTAEATDTRRERKRLRDLLRTLRSERRRVADGGALPFSFGAFFADAQARGGFDVVIGNPPWVRLHRIPATLRLQFKQTYEVYRAASWQAGALGARAGTGFASQVDLAALFVERSVSLLRHGGVLSLLLPVKLWRSLAGGGVRQFLSSHSQVVRLEDLSESKHSFEAAVYPSLLVARLARGGGEAPQKDCTLLVDDRSAPREWQIPFGALAFDETPGAPWLMLSPLARRAFDRVRAAGVPLAASIGAPRLGVKSGCNVAFVVRVKDTSRDFADVVDADGETGSIEIALLRPALRGEVVVPWKRPASDEWIVWTHDDLGVALPRLPDRARHWLQRHYGQLVARSDAARVKRWWSLFRVDAADNRATRVVWADFGRRPRALVLPPGDPAVPLNTCYVSPCADSCDAWALAALLNSPLAAAWLNALAEPARGGYRRYLGWTVGQLPLPRDWPRARHVLSQAAASARGSDSPDDVLSSAVVDAFGLKRTDVAALIDWAP